MDKMYIVVSNNELTDLINEVNEQMNVNSGEPLGGIMHSGGTFGQAMLIEIKTGADEVLPEEIKLMDIEVLNVSRAPLHEDPFKQNINILFVYKDEKQSITVDNYNADDIVQTRIKVRAWLQAQS